jgi:hypothetical protein
MSIRRLKSMLLSFPRRDDSFSNRSGRFARSLCTHVLEIHRRYFHVQVDSIHEGPADLSKVALHL